MKNIELWKELDTVALQHDIDWSWVKAHNGNRYNEEVDRLARKETKKLKYRDFDKAKQQPSKKTPLNLKVGLSA